MKIRLMAVVAILLFSGNLYGFEPKDTVYANCKEPQAQKADCSSFQPGKPAKNIIIFVNDGVGINEIYATRVFKNGPQEPLNFEKFPHHSLIKTCALKGVTDSAAASTALATGSKTNNTRIGQDDQGNNLTNTVELAKQAGKAVGVVTTDELPGATPAGFTVHNNKRTHYAEIAQSYLEARPDLLMGGGRKWFAPDSGSGGGEETVIHTASGGVIKVKQTPGRENLLVKAQGLGYSIVLDEKDLAGLPTDAKAVLGLFAPGGMDSDAEREADSTEPSMEQMMAASLKFLSKNNNGFFLVFESANSDSADHSGNEKKVVSELLAVEKAVQMAVDFQKQNPDTLILLTSDHDTGGMDVAPGNYKQGDYVKVKWTTKILPGIPAFHSSQKVGLFGSGPGSELVEKANDNTQVFCIISGAMQRNRD